MKIWAVAGNQSLGTRPSKSCANTTATAPINSDSDSEEETHTHTNAQEEDPTDDPLEAPGRWGNPLVTRL